MTPTKDDALAQEIDDLGLWIRELREIIPEIGVEMCGQSARLMNIESWYRNNAARIKQALTQPTVDVEALKLGPANEDEAMCQVTSIYNDGWNHCIDDLVSKGYLK